MASSWQSADALEIPAGRVARGRVRVPSSKSFTHRHLALALLAGRPFRLERPLLAEDTGLFQEALSRLGWEVAVGPGEVRLAPPRHPVEEAELACGNAGTLLRLLTAVLTAIPGRWRLDGNPRLRQRPLGPLVDALRNLGAEIHYLGEGGHPPVEVIGGTLEGGETGLDAGDSSQYLSALLIAGQRARRPAAVLPSALVSAPYVAVTRAVVAQWGGRVEEIAGGFRSLPSPLLLDRAAVEGDYSAAAYPAAAAVLTGGEVLLEGLAEGSVQGDRRFLELLVEMGGRVEQSHAGITVAGSGGPLKGLTADLAGMPDQVPTLAALAPFALGVTRILGVPHLRLKESDRLRAMATELARLGVPVAELPAGLEVHGIWADRPPAVEPVVVEPWDDHRIAMSLALVGLRRPGVRVARPGVVTKSYPDFWEHLWCLLGL
jgi:3-phosphoshikimate 1-carboxyvinyltransferase